MTRLDKILKGFKKTLDSLEKLETTLAIEEKNIHDLISQKKIEAEGLSKERNKTNKVISNIRNVIGE